MRGSTQRLLWAAAVLAVLALGTGCSGARIGDPLASGGGYLPVSGSASDAGVALPPPVIRRGSDVASREVPATEFVKTADEGVPPSWSTPAPVSGPRTTTYAAPSTYAPPPPRPPNYAAGEAQPVYRAAPTTYAAAPAAAVPLSQRCWSGCGLPCEDGVSRWHARVVGGWPFYEGTDAPEGCSYWGVDLGRTHCGCWGYDAYYRMSGAKFDREDDPNGVTKDGGLTHHVGLKLTYEKSFGRSKLYWWAGLGGGYWWTQDYQTEDNGWEVFGEAGLGYVINQTFRIRAGLNVHGADTDVGRKIPANDGVSRWLWLLAPVVELEVNF